MGERSKLNSVQEITPKVPSLDPPFAIFIDLCSCNFHENPQAIVTEISVISNDRVKCQVK